MVGEVHQDSIQPVITILKAWAANGYKVGVEGFEDPRQVSMLNGLLIDMIVGECRNGPLTDGRNYIYLKLDPETVGSGDTKPVLSLFAGKGSTGFRGPDEEISPREALIAMLGSIMMQDPVKIKRENQILFPPLLDWAKETMVSLSSGYFEALIANENQD